jgi:HAD superfamily hydrolase (TIGR01509 family)
MLIDFLRLVRAELVTALVTSSRRVNAMRVLEIMDIVGLFDQMIFGDDVERGKPDPEPYHRALRLTGLGSLDAVAFEDSPVGIASAVAAGLRVIRVSIGD